MKPAPFDYRAPETLDEVVDLLAERGDDAKVLAGGQSLVPLLALRLARFELLVDVNRIQSLAGVEAVDGRLRVGAMTRQAVLEGDPLVAEWVPLLPEATPLVGDFQIRNRGTFGGSLAHADPAAEYPAVAVALDAELVVASRGGGHRRVPAAEFFVSTWMTAAEPDELLVAAEFPRWAPRSGFAVEEVARRHGDFALAGVVCGVECDERGAVDRAALVMFGVATTPHRLAEVEQLLIGRHPEDVDLEAVSRRAMAEVDPPSDLHASADYRRRVTGVLVRRALRRAIDAAEGQ